MSDARAPDLFIIGAPKSGTTSLYEYLAGHPQVFMSALKEPFYLCPDVRMGLHPRLEYPADEERYLRLFAGAGDAQRVGEATTRYLVSEEAPRLVRDLAPKPFVVVSLREPVAMLQALHNERVANGNEDIVDFEQAINADGDRRLGRTLPPGANALGAAYRDNARYADLLERWFGVVGRDRVHVIVFDDLAADPAAAFRKLLTFLEVDANYQPPSFAVHNPRHRPRRLVRAIVESSPGRLLTKRLATAVIGEDRRARLAQRFRQGRFSRQVVAVQPVSASLRRMLEADLAPDVARLSNLLGRDLSHLWHGRPAQRPDS
ncbi:MAG: sulfotransferase [Chloroflexota bacterium]